ncbi:hypothetical protein BSKO_00881 [Bryopsis sp. KO-2023]|nr:hypothetical protein BSKO_00881 [Bryopsis sp. KO-2023]
MWAARFLAFVVFSGVLSFTFSAPVVLERLSQSYLPFQFNGAGTPVFCLGEAAAEQLAYDPSAKVLYVTGNKLVRVLDIQDPATPEVVFTEDVSGTVTDVVHCGKYVAFSIAGEPESSPGSLFVYSSYNPEDGMKLVHNITTGALPDALSFTPDCKTILTANEGEAGLDAEGNFTNPEGSVTIVNLEALEKGEKGVKNINFQFVNEDPEKYTNDGVRWVWKGQTLDDGKETQTLSKDLEPEQVVVTADGKKAFVNLQENNAIAILDLETMTFTSVRGLGLKDYGEEGNALDTSDADGGSVLRAWPGLFGLLQPDVITFFNHENEDFIVTANEGDTKEYDPEDHNVPLWDETASGLDLVENTTGIPEETVAGLADPALLGGLKISVEDGIVETKEDGSVVLDKLVGYGGRSWSIFKSSDMSLVYDSGNDLERVMAEYFPWSFNTERAGDFCAEAAPAADEEVDDLAGNNDEETFMDEEELMALIAEAELDLAEFSASPDPEAAGLLEPSTALTKSPNSTFDDRSASKGPEPEAVVVGNLNDRRLVFVTVERGNTIFVYDISDPAKPVWQSAIYPGAYGAPWAELYNRKEIVDVDPEGLAFASAEDSPTGDPLLFVSGAQSGTVSIYKIIEKENVQKDCGSGVAVEDTGKSTTVFSKATEC